MRIVVTGGAGFIGSHLVDSLIFQGDEVIVVDNLSTGRKANVNNKAVFYKLDINSSIIEEIFKSQVDAVVHLAAQVSVSQSLKNPLLDAQVNIIGSLHLINLSQQYRVKKFVYINSAAIFGNPTYFPLDEEHPQQPLSAYGISKSAVEKYLKISGLNFASLRLANVYGPRQITTNEGGVIAAFIKQSLTGESSSIEGSGEQTRDFIFVKDVVKAVICALEPSCQGCFNIGSGKETSINELHRIISQFTNCNKTAKNSVARQNDIKNSVFAIAKAKKVLQWEPETSLIDGLTQTINYENSKNIGSDLRL